MVQCYEFNYTSNKPQPLPDVWIPCPVGDNCCIGTDLCLSNNICHYTGSSKEKREASYSSYYNARCTDPTYTNPACDKICIDSPPDIVYNYTSNLWACCGNDTAGEVTCNDPLNEYYEAPAPGKLATLSSNATVVSTATLTPYIEPFSTATTTGTSSVTSAIPSESSSNSVSSLAGTKSNGLSTGAKAGVGIVVALGVIAVITAALFWVRKSKFKRRSSETPQEIFHRSELAEKNHRATEMPVHGSFRSELDTNESGTVVELSDEAATLYSRRLDSQRQRLELPSSS